MYYFIVNSLLPLAEMIVFIYKLGHMNLMKISWILIKCGFYENRRNSGLALNLKMLVLVSTISVPKFMLVSKSAQFTWNFELCRRTNTVEPRFNEVAGDRPNLFVKSRVRYIENLDITNLTGNDQNVRYIEVKVNDWFVTQVTLRELIRDKESK